MTPEQQRIAAEIVAEAATFRQKNQLEYYEPYLKQREFHRLGAKYKSRGLIAGNQVGKSHCGAAEDAFHLTGLYPKWWEGHRFDHPIKAWIVGPNQEKVRDTLQTTLFGPFAQPDLFGTGFIPRDAIVGRPSLGRGVSFAYDTATLRWRDKNGRLDDSAKSIMTFKSVTEGQIAFAADTIDLVHQDEETSLDIVAEQQTRLQVKKGIWYLTTTPLLGWTELITRMLKTLPPGTISVKMGLYDACVGHDPERPWLGHYTREQADEIIAGFPIWLKDAKAYGEPALGEGKIFLHPEGAYTAERPDTIPPHWRKIWGIDFGGAGQNSHPFAAALLAHDLDYDVLYLLHALKLQGMSLLQHIPMMRAIAPNVPVAWPHDGNEVDGRGSGATLAEAYRSPLPGMPGLKMLPEHATWPTGGTARGFELQPAIDDLDNRMATGRFKAFSDQAEFFEEARQYHREKFKVVKVNDDILSAVFKGLMMLRYAQPGYLTPPTSVGKYTRKAEDWWKPSQTVPDMDPFTGAAVPRNQREEW